MTTFELLRPLWLVALVPLVGTFLALRRARATPPPDHRFAAPHLVPYLLVPSRERPWLRPDQLLLPIGLLAVAALAGPSWRYERSPPAEDRAAVVVVLRIDESMLATDIAPSRLERARHKLHDLAAVRPGAPLGLVAYRGSAHVVTPITDDAAVAEQMAAALEPSVMPRPGDALPEALGLAGELLADAKRPGSILVMTDRAGPGALARLPAGHTDVQLLALAASEELARAGGVGAAARALGAPFEVVTVDDRDVRRLASRAEALAPAADASDESGRRDEGWALVPLIVLAVLPWARRGWSIQWD